MDPARESDVRIGNEGSYADDFDLSPVFPYLACIWSCGKKVTLDHLVFREDNRKIREELLCRIELGCLKHVLAFSHHRLIHQSLYSRDSLVAVITDKAVVVLVHLCVFLNCRNIITFIKSSLSSLHVTCRSLDKIELTEQRICSSSEVSYRR